MRPCDRGEEEVVSKKEVRSSLFNKKLPLKRQKSINFRKNVEKKRHELA